jgi:hypothetical protein
MRPVALVSAIVLAPLPLVAHAQEFPITIKPTPGGGATVQMGPDYSGDESTTATHQYRFESGPLGRSVLEVKSPVGARCEVSDPGQPAGPFKQVHRNVVPFAVGAEPDTYNRVVCQLPGSGVFEGSFVARRHTRGVLLIKGPTGPGMGTETPPPGPPPPAQPPSPPVQAPPPAPRAMDDAAFGKLLSAVSNNAFDNQKVATIRVAAGRNHFTTEQVGQLVDTVTFGGEKVRVVETTRLRIVDPENAANLLEHFTFDGEKKKVAALLESIPTAATAPPPQAGPGPAAPGTPVPVNAPMDAAAFDRLLGSIRTQNFDAQKLQAIQVAARNNRWTVNQVAQLVDLVSSGSDKVRVVELTRAKIVDPENAANLLEHFTFDADKRRAAKLLGN